MEALKEIMKANQEEAQAKRKADHKALKEKTDANTKANQDLLSRMESHIGSLVSRIEADRKTDLEEITASQE
jgi:hypothetical protein